MEITTTSIILGSAVLLSVLLYFIQVFVLVAKVPSIKTESKGTKQLKYQEYNSTWNKYCMRK